MQRVVGAENSRVSTLDSAGKLLSLVLEFVIDVESAVP
jgi:hypothetical protein